MAPGERVKRLGALRAVGPELPKEWSAEEEQLLDHWGKHEDDMGISVPVTPSTQYASPGGVANSATIFGRAANNMGPKGRQSFYAKRDIIARAPVSVSNRFQAIEDTTAEEVESVKDRELPVTGKAVKGQKLPLKGTPPVIGKKTLEEGQGLSLIHI